MPTGKKASKKAVKGKAVWGGESAYQTASVLEDAGRFLREYQKTALSRERTRFKKWKGLSESYINKRVQEMEVRFVSAISEITKLQEYFSAVASMGSGGWQDDD